MKRIRFGAREVRISMFSWEVMSSERHEAYLHKLVVYATKGGCFGGLAVKVAAISTGGEGGGGRRHNGHRGDIKRLIEA